MVSPALVEVSRRHWWAGGLLWLLALLTFAAFVGRWQPYLVLLYPLLVFGALALLMQQEPSAEAHAIEQG
jgi:asparagine N-glycosylation enzyme membrane subunit Stt3